MITRWLVIVPVIVACLLPPGVAYADAAAPSDYRTTIVSVSPYVPGLEVSIEGGDSFLRVRAPAGREVIVLGYAGEPYLRFAPDGTISRNRLSAATYENEQRFGVSEVPGFVDFEAAPEWVEVGDGGVWAWHDHRSHWMDDEPLIGLEPGDSLPAQAISLTVDGAPVVIVVQTTLFDAPSWWPAAFGLLIGLQLVLIGWWLGPATATLTTLVVALAATLVGAGQYLSLPAETGPLHTWWAVPVVALASAFVAIATYGRSELLHRGLLALSGSQLSIWAWQRRAVFTEPILPTDIVFWFDRATTAAALSLGGLLVILSIKSLINGSRTGSFSRRRA